MDRPIVLHLIDSFGIGGAQQRLFNDLQFLGPEFEHQALAVFGPAESRQARSIAVPLQTLGLERTREVPLGVARLVRLLSTHPRIRIVHTQLFWADLVGRLAARACGRPVVSTMQNACHERDSGWYSAWRHQADRMTARLLARAIAVSEYVRGSVLRRLDVPAETITVIPNAVDADRVRPDAGRRLRVRGQLGLTAGEFAWVIVSRLVGRKGLEDLLPALAHVAAQAPSTVLLIAGDGSLRGELEQRAAALDIADRVRFLGARSDVLELLDAADAFVLPSLHEGLPVAVLEAMAMEKPCVLSAIPAHLEIVEHGVNGIVTAPSDVPALARAMLDLQEEPAMRDRLGACARVRVVRAFAAASCARRLQDVYRSVLPHPAGTGTGR